MPIKIKGATSGSTTITAPNTGSDETIELSTALASKLAAADQTVIQIVTATTTTQTTVASTTLSDSGLSATITPGDATSKVLVIISQQLFLSVDTDAERRALLRLQRNGTTLETSDRFMGYRGAAVSGSGAVRGTYSYLYLDSPASISSLTYKTQVAVNSTINAALVTAQEGSSPSTIVLMEVSA